MNWKAALGIILTIIGALLSAGALQFLPDLKPVVSMLIVTAAGIAITIRELRRQPMVSEEKRRLSGLEMIQFGTAFLILLISLAVLTRVNWVKPDDPLAVVVLGTVTSMLMFYTFFKKFRINRLVTIAGLVFVVNFALIPVWEGGYLNFLASIYRATEPFYASWDNYGLTVERILEFVNLLLCIPLIRRKVRVADYGSKTLVYFILQPIMAIFLFEMFGQPAGWLAGTTTRSDLLSTDINAAGSTLGVIFIAVPVYIIFLLFPYWFAIPISGFWWPLWKSGMKHHPAPSIVLADPLFHIGWGVLSGAKRMVLPMTLIIMILDLQKRRKKPKGQAE